MKVGSGAPGRKARTRIDREIADEKKKSDGRVID